MCVRERERERERDNICNNNRINMSENKDNMDLEQSNSKLKMGR